MHELSIVSSVLETAFLELKKNNGNEILNISLKVGMLSGIEPDSIRFYFDIQKSGTKASNAKLDITKLPLTGFCKGCSQDVEFNENFYNCPKCNSTNISIKGGRELIFDSIEVI